MHNPWPGSPSDSGVGPCPETIASLGLPFLSYLPDQLSRSLAEGIRSVGRRRRRRRSRGRRGCFQRGRVPPPLLTPGRWAY